ncbi:MAG: hypothetical protein ACRCUT_11245, partial [Spirochaetota bacterium]
LQHDEASDVALTSDGGYITAGYTHSETAPGIYVVKFSADGAVQWSRRYGYGIASSIAATPDGNFVITATDRISMIDSAMDLCVLKIDPAGNILWQKTAGTAAQDQVTDAAVFSDGSIVIAGNTVGSDGYTPTAGLIIRMDQSGAVVWTKEVAVSESGAVNSIAQGADGSIIMAGTSFPDGGSTDFWAVNYSADGTEVWN